MSRKRKFQRYVPTVPWERFPFVLPELQQEMRDFWNGLVSLVDCFRTRQCDHSKSSIVEVLYNTYLCVLYLYYITESNSRNQERRIFTFKKGSVVVRKGYFSCSFEGNVSLACLPVMEDRWPTQALVLSFLMYRVYVDTHLCDIYSVKDRFNMGGYGDFSIECRALFNPLKPLGPIYTPYSFLIQAHNYQRLCARVRRWLPLLNAFIPIVESYLDVWDSLKKLELKMQIV